MTTKSNVVIYSKSGCCLCDKAKAILLKVQTETFYVAGNRHFPKSGAL